MCGAQCANAITWMQLQVGRPLTCSDIEVVLPSTIVRAFAVTCRNYHLHLYIYTYNTYTNAYYALIGAWCPSNNLRTGCIGKMLMEPEKKWLTEEDIRTWKYENQQRLEWVEDCLHDGAQTRTPTLEKISVRTKLVRSREPLPCPMARLVFHLAPCRCGWHMRLDDVFIWTLVSYLCHSLAAVAIHCEAFQETWGTLPASMWQHQFLRHLHCKSPCFTMVRSSGSEVHVQPSDSEREAGVDLQSLLFRLLHHWRRPRRKSEFVNIFTLTLAWGPARPARPAPFWLFDNVWMHPSWQEPKCEHESEHEGVFLYVPLSFLPTVVACDVLAVSGEPPIHDSFAFGVRNGPQMKPL